MKDFTPYTEPGSTHEQAGRGLGGVIEGKRQEESERSRVNHLVQGLGESPKDERER